jgi:ethanolamine utilization protein EutN
MMLARVIGNVVSTVKHSGLDGRKLLLLQPITHEGAARGKPLVAVDAIGAGYEETVYWCRGREAAMAFGAHVPTDATVVGIVDTIHVAADSSSGTSTAGTSTARKPAKR